MPLTVIHIKKWLCCAFMLMLIFSCEEQKRKRPSSGKKVPPKILNTDSLFKASYNDLVHSGIDTILLYELHCPNMESPENAIFWMQNGQSYILSANKRGEPVIIQRDTGTILMNIVAQNAKTMLSESVDAPTYSKGDKIYVVVMGHSCKTFLNIKVDSLAFEKRIDQYYLETKDVNGNPNKFYRKNLRTWLNKVKTMAENEMDFFKTHT